MNRITLKGYVVGETEIKTTPQGKTVIKFSISVKDYLLKDKIDNSKNHVSFFNCECWPLEKYTQSEVAKFVKGAYICFDARPVQDRWEKDGVKRDKIKFVVDGFIDVLQHINSTKQAEPAPQQNEDDEIPF